MIGGQPSAPRYIDCLTELLKSAPRPSAIITHARLHGFDCRAETMADSLDGERGQAAEQTAQEAWNDIVERRRQTARKDDPDPPEDAATPEEPAE